MDDKSYRAQIIIALIGLTGIIGGALITSWDKIFPPGQETPPAVSDMQPAAPSDKPVKQVPSSVRPSVPAPIRQNYFHGTYVGTTTEGLEEFYFKTTFVREGNYVTGSYILGTSMGTCQGKVVVDTFYYQWQSAVISVEGEPLSKVT